MLVQTLQSLCCWGLLHEQMNVSVASDFISLIYYLHHIGLFYNVAAASIAPAALNAALFVYLTSTAYIHSMYFAQPVS